MVLTQVYEVLYFLYATPEMKERNGTNNERRRMDRRKNTRDCR
jgi:hypothetical protein